MNEPINFIEFKAVTEELPPHCEIFCELLWQDILFVPTIKPDIEQLLKIRANIEVYNMHLADTPSGTSCEGQTITGKKVCCEAKIRLTIEYVSCDPTQSVHTADFIKIISAFIITPSSFNCDTQFQIIPYVENVFCIKRGCREMYCSLLAVLDLKQFTDHLYNNI